MYIETLNFTEIDKDGNEWSLNDFTFEKINLIVGQNSTGKSRVLNVINSLGNLLAGEQQVPFSGNFNATFKDDNNTIVYKLEYQSNKIINEELKINNTTQLNRGSNGIGEIFAVQLDQDISFQVPDSIIASVGKRDKIQHPFLEQLYTWGQSIRFYQFGTNLGKDHLAVFRDGSKHPQNNPNMKDTNKVVYFLNKGIKKFGSEFTQTVLMDINSLGYNLTDIGTAPLTNAIMPSPNIEIPEGIFIREDEHEHMVEQVEISQGLFRAISLFIQLRFSEKYSLPSLILIDDIGEGLDYERATKLIKAIIKIAESSTVQLVMTTNDRFTMNNIPLEYWSVLIRESGQCKTLNYENSKDIFDEFELTGLSNFDFFSSKYYRKQS